MMRLLDRPSPCAWEEPRPVPTASICRSSATVTTSPIADKSARARACCILLTFLFAAMAVIPRPTDTAPATVTLQASADQADRRVGSKKKGKKHKKGRKIVCLAATGQTTLTLAP